MSTLQNSKPSPLAQQSQSTGSSNTPLTGNLAPWVILGGPIALTASIIPAYAIAPKAAIMLLAMTLGWTVLVGPCGCAHVGAFNTLGCNVRKRRQWVAALVAYSLGGIVAGSVVGAALGLFGSLLFDLEAFWPAVLLVGVACVFRELVAPGTPIPEIRRQTRSRWFKRLPVPFNAAMWGADVGLTFATWLTFSGAWLLAVIAVVNGNVLFGSAVFAAYWVGRVLPHIVEPFLIRSSASVVPFIGVVLSLNNQMRVIHGMSILVFIACLVVSQVSGY